MLLIYWLISNVSSIERGININFSQIADVISIIAGLMTIIGLSGLLSWSFFKKARGNIIDDSISIFVMAFKSGLCILLLWFFAMPAYFLHIFVVLSLGLGHIGGTDFFWRDGDWYAYVASYLIGTLIWVPLYVLSCSSIFVGSIKPFKEFWARLWQS